MTIISLIMLWNLYKVYTMCYNVSQQIHTHTHTHKAQMISNAVVHHESLTETEQWLKQCCIAAGTHDDWPHILEWRRQNDVTNLTAERLGDVVQRSQRFLTTVYRSKSLLRQPVFFDLSGKHCNTRDWVQNVSREEFIVYLGAQLEHELQRAVKYSPGGLHRDANGIAIYVSDFDGYTMGNLCMTSYINSAQAHYRGKYAKPLDTFIMINMPWFVKLCTGILTKLIAGIAHTVRLVGTDKDEINSVLREYMAEDQIPARYGGTAKWTLDPPDVDNNAATTTTTTPHVATSCVFGPDACVSCIDV